MIPLRIAVVTLFPEMFSALRHYGVSGRGFKQGAVEMAFFNPRDYSADKHQRVDDRPYGGGPGMVMMVEPLRQAIAQAKAWAGQTKVQAEQAKVLYLSPQGRPFTQGAARDLASAGSLVLLAGRYEGIDERLISSEVDEEWSIGDYVLSGGELAAMVMADAAIRLLPGVLGHEQSAEQDSFSEGLLDCPHYTRPEVFEDQAVPQVLLSGDHQRIRRWRLKQALGRTWQRRPELLKQKHLSEEQQQLLREYQDEQVQTKS